MRRETILILIIIILILIIGLMQFNTFSKQEEITVGNINFTLPNGFSEGEPNNLGDVNITNGTHTLFIANYNSNNISYFVNQYANYSAENNYTVTTSNFTIDDIHVYKSVNDQTGSEHYWFGENGTIYSVYDWDNYDNIDNVIFDLIKSTDKSV